jgi:O-acetyl-ADP-ribose deacetylase (regulator of RNase III)/uncharacterized protein YwgA
LLSENGIINPEEKHMIELVEGNILEADADALVNTVNTKGVMGKGIALQFKKAFPEVFIAYKKACDAGEVQIGKMHVYKIQTLNNPRFIINFPTKDDWKKPSQIGYISKGLESLIQVIQEHHLKSIALPPLGCGQGGLKWSDVFPLIKSAFKQIPDVQLLLYPPAGTPEPSSMPNNTVRPHMTLSRAAVLQLLKQYCVLGYELTLLEVQKLLYFLQEAGEPLKLRFKKYKYGPYADNLRHVLIQFEGHFTRGFGDGSNKPRTPIEILPQALKESEDFISTHYVELNEFNNRLNRVKQLIEGFESPNGMEILSTIHWLVKHEAVSPNDHDELVKQIQSWSERKKNIIKPAHIDKAIQRLTQEKWI